MAGNNEGNMKRNEKMSKWGTFCIKLVSVQNVNENVIILFDIFWLIYSVFYSFSLRSYFFLIASLIKSWINTINDSKEEIIFYKLHMKIFTTKSSLSAHLIGRIFKKLMICRKFVRIKAMKDKRRRCRKKLIINWKGFLYHRMMALFYSSKICSMVFGLNLIIVWNTT